MKKVYVFLADGFEEIEALAPVDLLRRAGVEVVTVSIMNREGVAGSHGIVTGADKVLDKKDRAEDYMDADLLILPGGKAGTDNLAACSKLAEIIKKAEAEGKLLAAICAAPSVYGRMGLLKGKKATCYPGFEGLLEGAEYTAAAVEEDGCFITARGMGVSLQFGLKLIERLISVGKAKEIAAQIQM